MKQCYYVTVWIKELIKSKFSNKEFKNKELTELKLNRMPAFFTIASIKGWLVKTGKGKNCEGIWRLTEKAKKEFKEPIN